MRKILLVRRSDAVSSGLPPRRTLFTREGKRHQGGDFASSARGTREPGSQSRRDRTRDGGLRISRRKIRVKCTDVGENDRSSLCRPLAWGKVALTNERWL